VYLLSYDLDLESMTLILDPDLGVLKIYLYTKDEVTRSRLSKARSRTVQTCRQIHRPMRPAIRIRGWP